MLPASIHGSQTANKEYHIVQGCCVAQTTSTTSWSQMPWCCWETSTMPPERPLGVAYELITVCNKVANPILIILRNFLTGGPRRALTSGGCSSL